MVSKTLRSEIPRVLAEEFCCGAKDTAFHEHASVEFIIAVQACEALNGQSVQHDAVLLGNH